MTPAPPPLPDGRRAVPTLLTSLSSAVVLDASGDVTLAREARGAIDEWGGVYAELVRLTGAWRLFVYDGDREWPLSDGGVASRSTERRRASEHRLGRLAVHQEIAATDDPPGAYRSLRFSVDTGPPLRLSALSAFRPHLLPTLVEGIRPVSFRLQTGALGLAVRQRGFGLIVRSSVAPSYLYVDRASWIGGRRTGPVREIGTEHAVTVAPGAPAEVRWVIAGGLERDLGRTEPGLTAWLEAPEPRLQAAEAAEASWTASTPAMVLPDAPGLETAYRAARRCLRQLYSQPGDDLTGLVAGYPWYSAIWCRDVAWMLPAVIWLGDFEWADRTLGTVFRFQSRTRLPLLGGEPGELPMQVAPGPVFLYGTSDTTLYFPGLLERLWRHTGDAHSVEGRRGVVERVVAWGLARTDPTTGLLRHGGEAESIARATEAVAPVRYGIDAPDTTIWDSADRRAHAIDVQVLWIEALRAGAELARCEAGPSELDRCGSIADRLSDTVRAGYRWPEERYLYDSRRDGAPVPKLRPNALRAVSARVITGPDAGEIVGRAAEADLTTPWGVRTLSSSDPAYRAGAYHEGQVWPIATAWAADAAYAAGAPAAGYRWLDVLARSLANDAEGANECFRGDAPSPFNSCFVLGMSVGPFLTVLFERLWGLRVDARAARLEVDPAFPPEWRSAELRGLRVGTGRVDLTFEAPRLVARWTGPGALTVTAGGRSTGVNAGGTAAFSVGESPGGPKAS